MVSVIFGFLGQLVGWLLTHLPASPFANLSWSGVDGFGQYSIAQLLAWVNWIIPFDEMLTLFDLWLAAVLLASAVMFVSRKGLLFGTNGVLGGGNGD